MTLRLDEMGRWGLLVVLGCGGSPSSPGQAGPPVDAPPEICVIVDDSLVLPSDGGCRLSAQQRATYRLQGEDPACQAGRVAFGGLNGARVSLNGLQISCESEAQPPIPPGDDVNGKTDDVTPNGGADAGVVVVDPVPDGGSVSPAPSIPLPFVTEWTQFEDDVSTGCDLVNGADFEAIVPTDGTGRLVVVSRLNLDVRDFVLTELILDEDHVARAEPSGEVVARIRYKHSADGLRQLWLVRPDGRAWSLAEEAAEATPRTTVGVLCQACDLVDGADPATCAAAPLRPIPSEGISPPEALLERSSLMVEGDTGQVLSWRDFDSEREASCGVINASDARFAVVGDTFGPLPERLGETTAPMPEGFSLRFFRFDDPSAGGTWQLFGPGDVAIGDLVFSQDSADQPRLWLLGPDGTVLDGAFAPSGNTPEDLAAAACDPCTFFAGTRGQCIPL